PWETLVMKTSRRLFLKAACATAAPGVPALGAADPAPVTKTALDRILDAPVLQLDFLKQPVTVASVELLRHGKNFLVRTRSTDGAESVTVPNPARMADLYPVFLKSIVPVFLKKDARRLEALLWEVYRHNSNYKLQGLALWTNVAAMEMALLELLGQAARRPV